MSATAQFKVTADAVGHRTVEINGEDVSSRVAGVAVVVEVGQLTVVTLRHLPAAGEISGEGIVRLVDEGDSVLSFLEDIDPKELERATLDGLGPGSGSPVVEALEHLKRWARGN